MRRIVQADVGVLGISLSGSIVMLPLAPVVFRSRDNHILNADHIAAHGAAGGHGLRTVLIAGGIHKVAFQLRLGMRRGGQLSSEGGVCGDGRRGGIGIPSIAVVAGSIGSLSGQSRYRSGALALFHFLGAQRSAVLGHIVNGVRLGLRSAVASDLQSTGCISSTVLISLTGKREHTTRVVGTHVIGGQAGILFKGQQIIRNNCACRNLETESTQIQAIQNNAQIISATQRTALLKGVGVAGVNNTALGGQFLMSNTQVIRSITILTSSVDQIRATIGIADFRLSRKHATITGSKALSCSLTHAQCFVPAKAQLAVTKLATVVLQDEGSGYIIFTALDCSSRKIGAVGSLAFQRNFGQVSHSIIVSRSLPFLITVGDEVLVQTSVSSPNNIDLGSNIRCRKIIRCIYDIARIVVCCHGRNGSHGDYHQTCQYTGKKLLCAFTHKTFPPKLIIIRN